MYGVRHREPLSRTVADAGDETAKPQTDHTRYHSAGVECPRFGGQVTVRPLLSFLGV